jgi:hypothetical protein
MFLAMFMRIALLNQSIDSNEEQPVSIDLSGCQRITGQSIILLLGGLFLIYKSTEIREKVDIRVMKKGLGKAAKSFAFGVMIDLVFS